MAVRMYSAAEGVELRAMRADEGGGCMREILGIGVD